MCMFWNMCVSICLRKDISILFCFLNNLGTHVLAFLLGMLEAIWKCWSWKVVGQKLSRFLAKVPNKVGMIAHFGNPVETCLMCEHLQAEFDGSFPSHQCPFFDFLPCSLSVKRSCNTFRQKPATGQSDFYCPPVFPNMAMEMFTIFIAICQEKWEIFHGENPRPSNVLNPRS